jgi:hypothetical protein
MLSLVVFVCQLGVFARELSGTSPCCSPTRHPRGRDVVDVTAVLEKVQGGLQHANMRLRR